MSRIGNNPINLPTNVNVSINDNVLTVKGPKGELSQDIHPSVMIEVNESQVLVKRKNDSKQSRSLHGTFQRLVSNMVTGVESGFTKNLELVGTGYRVQKQGNKIVLALGLSHPVEYEVPQGITINVEGNNKISIQGISKQVVGQVAAEIRAFRQPEPYKGKGIRYEGEVVRRKAGKASKA